MALMEKLIGETEFLQDNPPKFVPQEDRYEGGTSLHWKLACSHITPVTCYTVSMCMYYVHVHTCVSMCIHVCPCACIMYMCMHVCPCACIMYMCMHMCPCACIMYMCIHVCPCAYMCVHVHVLCACICVHVHALCTCACISLVPSPSFSRVGRPRASRGGGKRRAWYTLSAHASKSLGILRLRGMARTFPDILVIINGRGEL